MELSYFLFLIPTSSRNGIREDCSPLWPISDGLHKAFTCFGLCLLCLALNFGPIDSISRFVLPGLVIDHFVVHWPGANTVKSLPAGHLNLLVHEKWHQSS